MDKQETLEFIDRQTQLEERIIALVEPEFDSSERHGGTWRI